MRRPALMFVTCALIGFGCNRTEEPIAPERANASSPPKETTAQTPASPVRPRELCIVPLGEPAPIANKAATCPRDPTGNLKMPSGKVTFTDAAGSPQVEVELARDDAARE